MIDLYVVNLKLNEIAYTNIVNKFVPIKFLTLLQNQICLSKLLCRL